MRNLALTISYDGTDFNGWQTQPGYRTVQETLEGAIAALTGEPRIRLNASGRTDAGVHAIAQVASFALVRDSSPDVIVRALNAKLPPEIRVTSAAEAPASFHARFDAKAKTYRYRLWNADVLNPFERAYSWHVPEPLDVAAMSRAARFVEGRHDFAAFRAVGGAVGSTERAIASSTLSAGLDGLLTYDVTGDGFLRHMVRAIVGLEPIPIAQQQSA